MADNILITFKHGPDNTKPLDSVAADKIGEPLWAKDSHILYVRNNDGYPVSPLPDIINTQGQVTDLALPSDEDFEFLLQNPASASIFKKVSLAGITTYLSESVGNGKVKVNALDTPRYLETKVRSVAPHVDITVSTEVGGETDEKYLHVDVLKATNDAIGVVKPGKNMTVTINGALDVETATRSVMGVASFEETDFVVTAGHVTMNLSRVILKDVSAQQDMIGQIVTSRSTIAEDPDGALVTKDYVENLVTNFENGFTVKQGCRAATTASISLTVPGAAIDGVTLVENDRVLVKNQALGKTNGVYVWTAADAPLTRAADFVTTTEELMNGLVGCIVGVAEGTVNEGQIFMVSRTVWAATDPERIVDFMKTGTRYIWNSTLGTVSIVETSGVVPQVSFDVITGPTLQVGGLPDIGDTHVGLNVKAKTGGGLGIDNTAGTGGVYIKEVIGGTW